LQVITIKEHRQAVRAYRLEALPHICHSLDDLSGDAAIRLGRAYRLQTPGFLCHWSLSVLALINFSTKPLLGNLFSEKRKRPAEFNANATDQAMG
jgi:hypothetical protein